MRTHVQIQALLAHYDYLPPDERSEVDAHLAQCPECAEQLAARDAGAAPARPVEPPAQAPAVPPAPPHPSHPNPRLLSPSIGRATGKPASTDETPEERTRPRRWQRMLVPLALALLFMGSLWIGMRGQDRPSRRPVSVETPAPQATEAVRNRILPVPPTDVPLTIDASGHVTITFACDEAVIASPEYRALAQSFAKANPDVTVKFITWERAVQEWQNRTGNLAGAVAQRHHGRHRRRQRRVLRRRRGQALAREGLVRNLAPLARLDETFAVDQFYPEVLKQGAEDGALALIPATFRPLLIRYDPDAFRTAGLREPHPGWSWDDLLNTAAALTRRDGTNTRRWGFGQGDGNLLLARFWSAIAAHQFEPGLAGGNPLQNGNVLELFRWADAFYVQARAAPVQRSSADNPHSDYEDQVRQGRFAMWTDGPTGLSPAPGRAVPFPVARAFDKTTPLGPVDGWAISSEAQYVDAAWRWVAYMSTNLPAGDGSAVPARRSVPQLQAFFKTVAAEDHDAYAYALEHLGDWPPLSDLDGSQQLWNALVSLVRGQTSLSALITRGCAGRQGGRGVRAVHPYVRSPAGPARRLRGGSNGLY